MFKKEAVEEMWVTGFEPPNRYTVEAESHGETAPEEVAVVPDEGSEGTVEDMFGDGGAIYLGDSSGCKIYNNVVRRAGNQGGAVGIW